MHLCISIFPYTVVGNKHYSMNYRIFTSIVFSSCHSAVFYEKRVRATGTAAFYWPGEA